MKCKRCNDTGMDLYEAKYGVDMYCDCGIGEKRQDKEMCMVCCEMLESCMCKKEDEKQSVN